MPRVPTPPTNMAQQMMRQAGRFLIQQAVPLALMGIVGFLTARLIDRDAQKPNSADRSVTVVPRGDLADDEKSAIALFENNAACVVHIAVREETNEQQELNGGSGFLWDRQGHIVTNHHVVRGVDETDVVLADASVWPAKVIGRAPSKDLAVLRIDAPADKLNPVTLGSSSDLAVGQKVFAIGNPFGLDRTLTMGIISALDRRINAVQLDDGLETDRTIDGVIQTDAAINPGNSGGPILDSHGRIIGVSTAIFSPTGTNSGVGFAVPIDTVAHFVPQLIQYGRIVRPTIGAQLAGDHVLSGLSDTTLRGVLVRRTRRDSPAELAGLRPTRITVGERGVSYVQFGDLITRANNTPITNLNDWYSFLESKKPGDRIRITIVRGLFSDAETELEIPITLTSE